MFSANLLKDETFSKTHDLLEMSGINIATYIARVKGESNVFASDPALRQYLSGDDESLRTSLMSRIDSLLQMILISINCRCIKGWENSRIEDNLDMSVSKDMMKTGT